MNQMAHKAYRYRFYPTEEQENFLRRTIGCCRLAYNKALHTRSLAWKERKERLNYRDLSAQLTGWKREDDLSFLKEVPSVPLQQTLRHLEKAYQNFFKKRARYPSFKKKRKGGSAHYTKGAFRWDGERLFLAKMAEPLNVRWSRKLPSAPSTVTVSLDAAGRWHVSMLCKEDIQPLPPTPEMVGIDLGLTHLATLSTGEKIGHPKYLKAALKKIRRASRNLSRKQKGSNNWNKARVRLARAHARVADRRKDHLHKLSTRLVRENQVIVVEDLNIRGMVKNRSLARAISDSGWSELVRQLAYKSEWYGRTFKKVDRFYPSSKLCSECGYLRDSLSLSEREWECPDCGAHHDRDHNAAKNILAAGLAVSACGADVRPGHSGQSAKKQEPNS